VPNEPGEAGPTTGPGPMAARSERGITSLWIVLGVAMVGGLIVTIPFVLAGREEAERGSLAVSQIGKVNDLGAQATMQTAIRTASIYFAEHGSYEGFGPEFASQYDPSVRFTAGPALPGVVSVRGVTSISVVMVTSTGSGFVCAAATGDIVTYGRVDAQSAAACTGGW